MNKHSYSQVALVIPCYNEETTIGSVLAEMLKLGTGQIIVVDDGSHDNSARIIKKIAERFPVTYIKNETNVGQGESTNRGFRYAAKMEGIEYIVTVDADGQHLPDDVKKIMDELITSSSLIVHGARYFGNNIPVEKKFANFASRTVFFLLYGVNHPDPTSGLRGYSAKLVGEINFLAGFDYLVSANRLIKKYIHQTSFVTTTAVYTAYSLSKGLNIWKGIALFFRMLKSRIAEICETSLRGMGLKKLAYLFRSSQ